MLVYYSAGLFAFLAFMHLLYTINDMVFRPRFFRPSDDQAFAQMQQSRTAISPISRPYWTGILGFHVSHSVGVMWFAGLIFLTQSYGIEVLKPWLLAAAIGYVILSWRCWFWLPTLGISIATALLAAGWLV
jgi:hypothetical protein